VITGDAFAGTLLCALVEGVPLEEALARANAAGAMTTLKSGALEAMPTKRTTVRALKALRLR
jgi:sugar/nucleoside kinase (ribokinase family)